MDDHQGAAIVPYADAVYKGVVADPRTFGPQAAQLITRARREGSVEALVVALRAYAWAQRLALHNADARTLLDEAVALAGQHGLARRLGEATSSGVAVKVDGARWSWPSTLDGLQAGDEVLRQVARRLQATTRPGDVLARYGGEEFAVIAPGTDQAALTNLAARLCAAVRAEPVVLPDGRAVALTVSVGAACLPADADQPEELVRLVDSALYTAKATGRNRVVHHAACAPGGPAAAPPHQAEQALPSAQAR